MSSQERAESLDIKGWPLEIGSFVTYTGTELPRKKGVQLVPMHHRSELGVVVGIVSGRPGYPPTVTVIFKSHHSGFGCNGVVEMKDDADFFALHNPHPTRGFLK